MVTKSKSVIGSAVGASYKEQQNREAEFIYQNNMNGETPEERWEEMQDVSAANTRTSKKYIENVISPAVEYSKDMTTEDWRKLACDYAEKMGFQENQWYAVKHNNTDEAHLHLIVNRISFEGKNSIDDSFTGTKSQRIAQEMCKEREWKNAPELCQDKKNNMKVALQQSLRNSRTWPEVQEKMEDKGYYLELNYVEKDGNQQHLNGARIMLLEELRKRVEKEKLTEITKKRKFPIHKASYMSIKEKKFVKSGFKLSEIDRKMKIKDLDLMLKKNNVKEEKKHEIKPQYGRKLSR